MDSTSRAADSTTVQVDLTKLRQMLGVAVPSLLVANLAALGVLVAATTPLERPAAATAPAPRQLAVITMPDGTRFLVDPSAELGLRAIRAAVAEGGTVRYITAPDTSRGGSRGGGSDEVPLEVPEDDDDGIVPIPEGSALDQLIDSLITPVLTIPVPGGGGSTVGDAASPLTELLDTASSTLTGLADGPVAVTGVVSDPDETVAGTVDGALGLLGALGAQTTTTTTTAPPAAPTTTTTAPTTTTTTSCLLGLLCH
jgi:hypothetical protein